MALVCSKALSVRLAEPADEMFLYQLYASTRAAELAGYGWNAAQQTAFLQLQFRAQQQHYAAYPNATNHIIEHTDQVFGKPVTHAIGRMLTSRPGGDDPEIRLVDISLLPEHCGKGVGTALLQWLQTEARLNHHALRLHVAPENPARRLYERLGFQLLEDRGSHLFLEWRAAAKEKTVHAG
ncbi:MAG: GNAT family N-acetyltransferase [Acidobacteria bacterium]|nr:GNAT family N-acetyltransferase [Acidobacteriota bacterium]MBI3427545.1 GNAT family N-acetyltransferase [Acidobacteriota bacterium]